VHDLSEIHAEAQRDDRGLEQELGEFAAFRAKRVLPGEAEGDAAEQRDRGRDDAAGGQEQAEEENGLLSNALPCRLRLRYLFTPSGSASRRCAVQAEILYRVQAARGGVGVMPGDWPSRCSGSASLALMLNVMHSFQAALTFVLDTPAYTLPPDLLVKARALEHLHVALYFGGTAWTLLALGLLLRWRVGAALAGWARRVTMRRGGGAFAGRPFLEGLLVAPAWLLILAGIALPGALVGHTASLRYGLSVERWGAWWGDWVKGELLTLVIGTLVLAGLFALLRRSPRLWWVWFWAGLQPFVMLGVYLSPLVIDPLFNHFTPLARQSPVLVGRLKQIAALGGLRIPPERMFVEDASRRSTGMNAYVTGIGGSKRIVVWDTTLAKVPPDEILAIYAHEQGHYVLGHIWKGIVFSAALLFVLLALLATLLRSCVRSGGARWHIGDESDWAALPVLLLLAACLSFVSEPVANAWSRMDEHAADVYGQRLLTRLLPNAAQIEVEDFNRLGRAWLEDPRPNGFVVWWTYTHPPLADRAENARKMGRGLGAL
jgi:STE24 endopeptidase